MEIQIKKKYQLAGRTIHIKRDLKVMTSSGAFGESDGVTSTITLMDQSGGVKPDKMEMALVHEMIHQINIVLGAAEHDVEEYVTPLAELLYQFIKQL